MLYKLAALNGPSITIMVYNTYYDSSFNNIVQMSKEIQDAVKCKDLLNKIQVHELKHYQFGVTLVVNNSLQNVKTLKNANFTFVNKDSLGYYY